MKTLLQATEALLIASTMPLLNTVECFQTPSFITFGFSPTPAQRTNNFPTRHTNEKLFSSPNMQQEFTRGDNDSTTKQQQQQPQQEEALSDVDARVLREMLQESKLDLQTEDDIRQLLQRGTVKSTVNPKVEAQEERKQRAAESPFESTLLQTFTDTKLWKKLSAQTNDLLESAKIWVANKVEQDLQVAAALGLFAWERAVKDVARALPAAGTVTKRTILQLTNQSSYEEAPPQSLSKESLRQDLNRPADEIKDVSRAIWGILQGETPQAAANARGLRTAAAAGTVNAADRQRRAFSQRRKLDRRDKDWTRLAGGVVDATYELQQELKAETSTAGYKTKPLRQAIKAGTVGVLTAVRDTARLAAARRQETRALKQAAVDRTVVYTQLLEERTAIQERLSACIDTPLETWLSAPSEELARETLQMTEDGLREVATLMVLVRNEMTGAPAVEHLADLTVDNGLVNAVSVQEVEELIELLQTELVAIQELRSRVATDISYTVADALYSNILGLTSTEEGSSTETPLILRLDELQASLRTSPEVEVQPTKPNGKNVFFADVKSYAGVASETASASSVYPEWAQNSVEATGEGTHMEAAYVVDVVPEKVVKTMDDTIVSPEDTQYKSFLAEVVSDEDVASAFGEAKAVQNLSEEELLAEEAQEEPSLAVKALLRVLDVAFFVLEKSVTVVLPAAYRYSVNAKIRYQEIQRNGQGRRGWEFLRRSADAKGRY